MKLHRRTSWLRRGIIIPHVLFLLPVLELAGLHWTWGLYASGRLDQQVAEYRKAGEPVTWEELIGPAVPDAENAAIELQQAFKALDYPSINALAEIDLSMPLKPADAAIVRRAVEANREAIRLVRAAAAKPRFDWHIQPAKPLISILFPALNDLRGTAKLLRAAAIDAHANGDDERAIRHIREMLLLARGASRHPSLVGHLVYIGVVALADQALTRIAPDLRIGPKQAGGDEAPPEQVKALIAELLDPVGPRNGLRDALYMERMFQIDSCRSMPEGIDILGNIPPGRARIGGYLARPLLLTSGYMMADNTTRLLRIADAPDWPACLADLQELGHVWQKHQILGFFARIIEPAMQASLNRHYRHLADRRLAAAALAIRWFAVDHNGKLPARLEDLVPAYLPAVPLDPFAAGGKSIVYIPADNPRIYSVGENMQDDGGSSAPMDPNRPANNNPWAQMDVVVLLQAQK